jgi:hypothetical protein
LDPEAALDTEPLLTGWLYPSVRVANLSFFTSLLGFPS